MASSTQQPCPLPCEEMILLATLFSITISQGQNASNTQVLAQFFNVVSTILNSLAFCRGKNEGLGALDAVAEDPQSINDT
ncbi:MAG: hypothetical protein ACOX7F_06340 [Eubacteriales bacterium]|jgi:hypothetical protein